MGTPTRCFSTPATAEGQGLAPAPKDEHRNQPTRVEIQVRIKGRKGRTLTHTLSRPSPPAHGIPSAQSRDCGEQKGSWTATIGSRVSTRTGARGQHTANQNHSNPARKSQSCREQGEHQELANPGAALSSPSLRPLSPYCREVPVHCMRCKRS